VGIISDPGWAFSSVGRASARQAEGRRFESCNAHHSIQPAALWRLAPAGCEGCNRPGALARAGQETCWRENAQWKVLHASEAAVANTQVDALNLRWHRLRATCWRSCAKAPSKHVRRDAFGSRGSTKPPPCHPGSFGDSGWWRTTTGDTFVTRRCRAPKLR
jgi:hypothetical protein